MTVRLVIDNPDPSMKLEISGTGNRIDEWVGEGFNLNDVRVESKTS